MTKWKKLPLLARRLLLLPVLFALVCSFATPALADQEDLDELLAQLALLQNQDIDPTWTPDIQANQATVAAMLAAYRRTTKADRERLTSQQIDDLTIYFKALYTILGRDPLDVAALFSGIADITTAGQDILGDGSSSSSSAQPQSASSSSSSQATGPAQQNSQSSSVSSAPEEEVVEAPASTTTDIVDTSGIPSPNFTPQVPQASGLFALLSSAVLSTLLMLIMILLCIAIFIRFLAALRTEAKERNELVRLLAPEPVVQDAAQISGVTLFPLTQEDIETERAPKRHKKRKPHKERKAEAQRMEADVAEAQLWQTTPGEEKIFETSFSDIQRQATDAGRQQGPQPPSGPEVPPPQKPSEAWAIDISLDDDTPKTRSTPSTSTTTQQTRKQRNKKNIRTGKPNRMPFHVGSLEDLDGIDE